MRKMQRFTLTDVSPELADRMRSALSLDGAAGCAKRVSGGQAGAGQAGGVGSRNENAVGGASVMLPWPSPMLSPNARTHWAQKSKLTKSYRAACALHTKCADLNVDWEGLVHVAITFFPPDRRHRDMDNLISSAKGLFDGVADALCINDRRFRLHPVLSDDTYPGGAVLIELFRRIEDMA